MSKTEDNNDNKEKYSRPQNVAVIKSYIDNKDLRFFEFLGGGIGANYYADNLDVKFMTICENNLPKLKSWNESGEYEKLKVQFKHLVPIDAYKHFCEFDHKRFYDVVNLDFCTFFYDNGKPNCTASLIDKVFEKQHVANGGLVFFTFQITGIGVNMHRLAIKNQDDISHAISEIAESHNCKVEHVHTFTYKASRPTTMLNLAFKVTYS